MIDICQTADAGYYRVDEAGVVLHKALDMWIYSARNGSHNEAAKRILECWNKKTSLSLSCLDVQPLLEQFSQFVFLEKMNLSNNYMYKLPSGFGKLVLFM